MFILKKEIDYINGNQLEDTRPISISSPFFKILEQIILNRIYKLTKDKIIKPINKN